MVVATRSVEYRLFEALGETCGVALWEAESGSLLFRFRRDWSEFAGEEASTLEALCEDLERWSREAGERPEQFLRRLDDTLSNTLSIGEARTTLASGNLDATLNRLYNRHVHATPLGATHVPLWSVKLAAGGWSQPHAALEEGVIEGPADARIGDDMFVAQVVGRSMEPEIPNGSLCLFRRIKAGSRAGKIVVVEHAGLSDDAAEYTIKRYESRKKSGPDGRWEHEEITMRPANPEYQEWALESSEGASRVVAEFVSVLESPEPAN